MEYVKEVFAHYDRQCIRVYQAYNPQIAKEAAALQTFGEHFNRNRMTWIKPSFLWMMYRSGWGTKKNQDSDGCTGAQWERAFHETTVYCQWDPDRTINGTPMNRAAIQIGLKGSSLSDVLESGICRMEDLTPLVRKWNEQRKKGTLNAKQLPVEKQYPVKDQAVRKRLNMK